MGRYFTIGGQSILIAVAVLLHGCATNERPTRESAKGYALQASLIGSNTLPPGDPDGFGTARISLVDASNSICVALKTNNLSPIDLAHIHRGRPGASGTVVVSVDPPDQNPNDDCTLVTKALLREIQNVPGSFYIDVHSTEYPRGAIRGQLMRR